MTNLKAFKAYDIRGVWRQDLNPELVYKIGYFMPGVFDAKRILLGRDIRLSSPDMFKSLSEGIRDAGASVVDAGLSTTPMIYWGTGKFDFDASVMITASHNTKDYNGLKFSGKGVVPVGYANGLDEIEKLILSNAPVVPKPKGAIEYFGLKEPYLEFLSAYQSDLNGLKISIDFSNGMAGMFANDLFKGNIHFLNQKPDGEFPAHAPNPLEPENQQQIKKAVLEKGSDIGLIFDGDADRVMFIDEKGNFVSPDLIIALLGHFFLKGKRKREKVVQDIRTSRAVAEYLEQFGAEIVTWRVGRAFGATRLKEVNGIYGGELAGHYYFRDFYYSDSGIMAALIVLQIVNRFHKEGKTFSALISNISSYANTGEVNFKVEEKKEAMDMVKVYFEANEPPLRFLDFDGYRFDFEDWWFNLRPSNTEPYLRFLAEAKNQKLLQEKTKVIFELISRFE